MIIPQILAVTMILTSSALTGWVSQDITFPAILCMLGLLGVRRRFTWDIRPERQFITPMLLLLLAILFSLHCHYSHVHADQAAAFAWQTIARYFLASMILVLFLRPTKTETARQKPGDGGPTAPPSLPASLGLFHLASVMAAGQVLLLDDRYVAFRLLGLLSVTLVILYAVLDGHQLRIADFGLRIRPAALIRNPQSEIRNSLVPWLPLALLLPVAVNLGWIGGSLLYRHVETINFLSAWLSRGSVAMETTTTEAAHVGFSTSGKLSSLLTIKQETDTAPVLTITGDSNPTYLRARAFATYRPGQWWEFKAWEAVPAEPSTPFGLPLVGRTYLFRLHEEEAPREVTVRHEASQGESLFTPLGTCFVEAPFDVMMRDDDDVVGSRSVRNRQSYRVGYGFAAGSRAPSRLQLRHMTAVPASLDPRIRPLAKRIFQGRKTTAEKIEAVTRYFQANYTYALGLEIPPDQDPLNYFLLEASTGYCEYFASGAAILLRLADVPTRYVTGFLVSERGSDNRSWIARNMDAHAWVEAWDGPLAKDDLGAISSDSAPGKWVIVEATITDGLDDTSLADELVRSAGKERPFLTELVQSLYEYGVFGVAGRLFHHGLQRADWRWAPAALVVAGLALGLALRLGRRRKRPRAPHHPQVEVLHRWLALVDRQAIRLGYCRGPEETLRAFAARLQAACQDQCGAPGPRGGGEWLTKLAQWYLQYADLRYCRIFDPVCLEQLQQFTQRVRETRPRRLSRQGRR